MANDIQRAIEVLEFIHGEAGLPKARLAAWTRSTDPDVLGAAYSAASNHWQRFEPRISRLEFGHLLGRLLAVALRKKGATHFSLSNYQAARTFGGWMVECFQGRGRDSEAERSLRWSVTFLASLYKRGDRRDRRCLVDGTIEHLFAVEGMATYFETWKRDRVLARAHREAMEWVRDKDGDGDPGHGGKVQ
jgi:hypothetical protein